MNPQKWSEIKRIFAEVVDLLPEERNVFLAENCADEEIHAEVGKLIASDGESETISGGFFPPLEILPPKQIGNYKIIEELGSGGMGTVFLAVREDLNKKVALKVVKYEFSSKEIKRRFENERKILAQLEHQNIAGLFDGGATNDGLPYFVMEYVEGNDLLTYCNENQLNIEERLKIFRKICAAVSYAHGKLIVHRDLKPSNIIVTNDGEPKLLDFGISKLLDETSIEQTGTATALGMMTPNYASPEQFRGEPVSTATDIYSLGVILYELLTGIFPYKVKEKRIDEIARAVCEIEPTVPSRAFSAESELSTNGFKGGQTTNHGKSETGSRATFRIQRSLRGDLDNIILKALRKEPERRYSSVEKFSDDIRAHLEGLPVAARPATFSYRTEKFVRRNRSAVLTGLLIFLSLFVGIIGISWQYLRAERERKSAEQRFNQVRQLANNVVFKYHDAIKDLPGATKAREMLVEDATVYLDNLASETNDSPELEYELARAYYKIGNVQGEVFNANLGNSDSAINSYRKSVSLLEDLAARNPENYAFRDELQIEYSALILVLLRQQLWREGYEIAVKNVALGEESFRREPQKVDYLLGLLRSKVVMGDARKYLEGSDSQTRTYREAVDLYAKQPSEMKNDSKLLLIKAALLQRLGTGLEDWGEALKEQNASPDEIQAKFAEAIEVHRQSLRAMDELEKREPESQRFRRNWASTMMNIGSGLSRAGLGEESLPYFKSALDRMSEISKADLSNIEARRDVAEALQYLAMGYEKNNESEKALENYRASLAILEKITLLDPKNNEFLEQQHLIYNSIGDIYGRRKNFAEALRAYQSGLDFTEKISDSAANQISLFRSESLAKIGDVYKNDSSAKKSEKSLEFYRQSLKILKRLQEENKLGKDKEYKIDILTKKSA